MDEKIDRLEHRLNELEQKISDIERKSSSSSPPIPLKLNRYEKVYSVFIILFCIAIFTGFLVWGGWFPKQFANVSYTYDYSVNVGEIIGLTLAGIGVAVAGVGYGYKLWAEGKEKVEGKEK